MAYSISTSRFSFIQFLASQDIDVCGFPVTDLCFPVYDPDDVWWQWYITASTPEELDALCDEDAASVTVGLVEQCTDGFLIQFAQKPIRYRLSPTTMLYVWQHGMPGFTSVLDFGECFHTKIQILTQSFCSTTCFQRIKDPCFTTVLQYSNDANAFGFAYCAGGENIDIETDDCEPTIIQFSNQATMAIPWTAFLQSKYGDAPNIAAWINDGGELVQAGIRIAYDTYPVNEIRIDFGGVASGVVRIS